MSNSMRNPGRRRKKPGLFDSLFGPPEQRRPRPAEIKTEDRQQATKADPSVTISPQHHAGSAHEAVSTSAKPEPKKMFSAAVVNDFQAKAETFLERLAPQDRQVSADSDTDPGYVLSHTEKMIKLLGIVFLVFVIGYCMFSPSPRTSVADHPISDRAGDAVWSDITEVKVTDIKKRVIYSNALKRNIIVVDGTVENVADYDISHIKLMVLLKRKQGSYPAVAECFAGIIMDDEELTTMNEAQMKAAFKEMKPRSDRLEPNGHIPFQAAFPDEARGYYTVSARPVYLKKY